ncbi:MAG TPA: LPS export ABC transporter periplasmic protein LptC [Rhodanobacter sp.]|nr:LPS export ABC transporter periplasmic protein LptC [Rhodanobacter sp.]
MNLRLWLRDRRLPVATIVIGLAAAASQLLLWWLGPAPQTHDFVGPPRSGYTLTDARVIEYGIDGKPGLHMQSPRVERREGDDSLYLNSPTFQMPAKQAGVPDWQGQSRYGWVNKPGTILKLQGPVYMHRPAFTDAGGVAQPEASMHTSDVTAWPKENRMETAQSAQLAQGDSRMTGIGMRANLTDNHLELLHDVHGILFSRPRNAPTRPDHDGHAAAAAGTGKEG